MRSETVDGRINVCGEANRKALLTYELTFRSRAYFTMKLTLGTGGGTAVEVALHLLMTLSVHHGIAYHPAQRWVNRTRSSRIPEETISDPVQVEEVCWQIVPFKDIDGLYNDPLSFISQPVTIR